MLTLWLFFLVTALYFTYQEVPPAYLKTKKGEALFWTGTWQGESLKGRAASYAQGKGLMTLEMLLDRGGVTLPFYNASCPTSSKAWRDASKGMAELASGNILVLLGDSYSEQGVFFSVERPALLKNALVSSIIEVPWSDSMDTNVD